VKRILQTPLLLAMFMLALVACTVRVDVPPIKATAASAGPATTAQAPTQEAATFFAPEDAIQAYLDGVAQNDVAKILQACAIDEMAENFKFDRSAARLSILYFPGLAPSDNPLYVEMNKAQLTAQILNQVKYFAYGLLSHEEVGNAPVVTADAERANKFMQDVDPKRLSTIALNKIALPNPKVMKEANYLTTMAKNAAVYGADEATERVALITFDENRYLLGFTLLRFGNNWKISTQSSALANTSSLGIPQKTTIEEFDTLTSGN
jgi:hypothetical protein